MLGSFNDSTTAVFDSLREIRRNGWNVQAIQDPTSVGSLFGKRPRETREIMATGFILRNPRARVVRVPCRPLNLSFAIANFLWTIRGDDNLEMISFYNDRARTFSPDGTRLVGSIGKRVFAFHGINQLEEAMRRLKEDAQSRRAVIQMFSPTDLASPPLDTPCSVSFQLLVRDERLHWITYMRSQSAAMVMPYDLFLFTMLHEAVAVTLNLRLGLYYHFCGSMHYYDDEANLVDLILANDEAPLDEPMEPMDVSPFAALESLMTAEEYVRASLLENPGTPISTEDLAPSPYWKALFDALIWSSRKRLGVPQAGGLEKLPNAFRIM